MDLESIDLLKWGDLNAAAPGREGVYEEIGLTQRIAGNPLDVLATNFGVPAAAFPDFPTHDGYIV